MIICKRIAKLADDLMRCTKVTFAWKINNPKKSSLNKILVLTYLILIFNATVIFRDQVCLLFFVCYCYWDINLSRVFFVGSLALWLPL